MNLRALSYCLLFYGVFSSPLHSQNYSTGFSQVPVASGISKPTALAFSPDGRIFVAEQSGKLRVIKNGSLLPTPFVSLSVQSLGETGLIGVAVDPNFTSNQYIYVYHTNTQNGVRNRISRFKANGDVAQPGSEEIILELDLLTSINHNGGAMHFGPDGKLFVAVGESTVQSNSQNLDTYHGKLLRINPDGSIPAGNPFSSGSEQRRRVWSYGLRNPFTFDIQPGTGKILVNDVGQTSWEEINDASSGGLNFGWPLEQGPGSTYESPIHAYGRGSGYKAGCAITGGTFFNPQSTNYPAEYIGRYFFMDYCQDWINMLDFSGSVSRMPFASGIGDSPLAITTGTDGNLYFLRRNGVLYKIIYTDNSVPVITSQPQDASVAEGQSVSFSVSASGSNLSYQWQKNGADISGATSSGYTIGGVVASDAGDYRVVVSNSKGSVTSSIAKLTVTVSNNPPVATILMPIDGTTYGGGQSFTFSGEGNDTQDGILSAVAFTWILDFHHNNHVHDSPPIAIGTKTGSFTIPAANETSANVWYRLYLVVEDSEGLTDTTYIELYPRTTDIGLDTQPSGLMVTLDGQPSNTPGSIIGVEGIIRQIGAISPQTLNGVTYKFDRWEHGGAMNQTITVPVDDVSYTAIFSAIPQITAHPQDQSVLDGESASFGVTASGTAPLSYQWQKDGVDIVGATASTYSIASASAADQGDYQVVVSNGAGSVTSSVALLTVTPVAPQITAQPQDQTVAEGESASFGVTASGTDQLSYQWQKDGADIIGATTDTYSIASASAADQGDYQVVVSNAGGSVTSNIASLTVVVGPQITAQPQDQTVIEDESASFGVTATGTSPLTYQWQKDGVDIVGATTSSYSIASASAADQGDYQVVVGNGAGSVTSNAASLTVVIRPQITAHPQDQTVIEDESASFGVTASGTDPLSYQWQKEGVDISGATASTYSIASASAADQGDYQVVVSNGAGSVTSTAAVLTVTIVTGSPTVVIPPSIVEVYPNPFKSRIFVKLTSQSRLSEVEIYDQIGHQVVFIIRHSRTSDGLVELNLDDKKLLPGIFLVRLKFSDSGRTLRKLIKVD